MFRSRTVALATKTLFWLTLAVTVTLTLMPAGNLPAITLWDKAQHFLAFLVLAVLALAAFPARPLWLIGALLSLCGAMIEVIQGLPIIHRDSDVKDWIADTLAIVAVLVPVMLIRSRRKQS